MYFTRSPFLFDGGGVIGERGRLSITGGGGGGGGAIFFGIFFRLLIKPVEVVLFEEGFTLGDDSRLILIFDGDLFIVDVGSILIEIFWDGLLAGICIGFFNGIDVVGFDGDGTASFFLGIRLVDDWIEGFKSGSDLIFIDGRDLESMSNEFYEKQKKDLLTFNRSIGIRIFYWYSFRFYIC